MIRYPYAAAITDVDPQAQWPTKYIVDPSGCWLFQGLIAKQTGYGRAKHGGKLHYAHRLMFRLHRGEIPAGMTIDHVDCVSKSCVNPDHFDLVTVPENSRRARLKEGAGGSRRQLLCRRGLHVLDETRMKRKDGTTLCGVCYRESQRRARERRRQNA